MQAGETEEEGIKEKQTMEIMADMMKKVSANCGDTRAGECNCLVTTGDVDSVNCVSFV